MKLANLSEEPKESMELARDAIRILSEPDKRSVDNQDFEGRRIKKVGEEEWLILNGEKYEEQRRGLSARIRKTRLQKERREAKKLAAGSGPLSGEATFLKSGVMPHEYELEGKGNGGVQGSGGVSGEEEPAVERTTGGTLPNAASERPGEDGGKGDNPTGVADGGVLSEEEKERFRKQFLEAMEVPSPTI